MKQIVSRRIPSDETPTNINEHITVDIFRDGNEICALIGENLQEGCAGFGIVIAEALRNLANNWEEYGYIEGSAVN